MVGVAAVGEDPGVHARVQGLDPTVEALGEPGEVLDRVTGTPCAAMVFAVEPVDTMATPASFRPSASSGRPVLSYTETSARRIGRRASAVSADSRDGDLPIGDGEPLADHPADEVDELGAFGRLDPLGQASTVSSSSTGTATWATMTPVSTPSSTTNRVAPVTLTP